MTIFLDTVHASVRTCVCTCVSVNTRIHVSVYPPVCVSYAASVSLSLSLSLSLFCARNRTVIRDHLSRAPCTSSTCSIVYVLFPSERNIRESSMVDFNFLGRRTRDITLEHASRSEPGRESFSFSSKAYEQRNRRKVCLKSI